MVTAPVGTDDSGTEVRVDRHRGSGPVRDALPAGVRHRQFIDFTPGAEVTGRPGPSSARFGRPAGRADRANIALAAASETLDRAERLEKSGNVTASALSDARQAVQQAEIDVRIAELDLAKRTIHAPFDGVIGLTDISAAT